MILEIIKKFKKHLLFILFCSFQLSLQADNTLFLRENLKKAKSGDYIVTMQNKTFTLFRIDTTINDSLLIEEVSIPVEKFKTQNCSFKTWFEEGAKNQTSQIIYEINPMSGQIMKSYVFLNGSWYEKTIANSFLSTLLNLSLNQVPLSERKKIGRLSKNNPAEASSYWQPRLIFEGQWIENVPFYAWRTKWPNDKSDLSGKIIEIYTPEDSELYPSYLPYWLEISGMVGSAKIRIVDSGRNLKTKHPF